jgi:ArsR family transcriptional regulator
MWHLRYLIHVATPNRQPELTEDQMQMIARALADPRRYDILKRLGSKPGGQTRATPCSVIRDCCDISPATLSHHMKELETAGLVRSEKDGKFVHYTPQADVLRAYLDQLRSDLG